GIYRNRFPCHWVRCSVLLVIRPPSCALGKGIDITVGQISSLPHQADDRLHEEEERTYDKKPCCWRPGGFAQEEKASDHETESGRYIDDRVPQLISRIDFFVPVGA